MSAIENIERKIAQTREELKTLEVQLKETKLQSPDKLLASELHGLTCNWNHTDGCGWFYEFNNKIDNWDGSEHGRYLQKAQKLISKCKEMNIEPDQAISVFRLVKGL